SRSPIEYETSRTVSLRPADLAGNTALMTWTGKPPEDWWIASGAPARSSEAKIGSPAGITKLVKTGRSGRCVRSYSSDKGPTTATATVNRNAHFGFIRRIECPASK